MRRIAAVLLGAACIFGLTATAAMAAPAEPDEPISLLGSDSHVGGLLEDIGLLG
ncbi:hypothetical protein AB0451_05435 [Streptomyces sp. NPDC052000]|uniref:hypothetical protein n=1 Tax=Streptomyces sp. NPDC052000 TaxID=3155676 RepID=UPI003450BB6A